MDVTLIPSDVLQDILITRAIARTAREIARLELVLAGMRLKQAARERELARQAVRRSKPLN